MPVERKVRMRAPQRDDESPRPLFVHEGESLYPVYPLPFVASQVWLPVGDEGGALLHLRDPSHLIEDGAVVTSRRAVADRLYVLRTERRDRPLERDLIGDRPLGRGRSPADEGIERLQVRQLFCKL